MSFQQPKPTQAPFNPWSLLADSRPAPAFPPEPPPLPLPLDLQLPVASPEASASQTAAVTGVVRGQYLRLQHAWGSVSPLRGLDLIPPPGSPAGPPVVPSPARGLSILDDTSVVSLLDEPFSNLSPDRALGFQGSSEIVIPCDSPQGRASGAEVNPCHSEGHYAPSTPGSGADPWNDPEEECMEHEWYSSMKEDTKESQGSWNLVGSEVDEPVVVSLLQIVLGSEDAPQILGPSAENEDLRRFAIEYTAKRRRVSLPRLPWQTGPFNMMWSKGPLVQVPDLSFSDYLLAELLKEEKPDGEAVGVAPTVLGKVNEMFRRRLVLCKAPKSDEQIRATALKRLKVLICLGLHATQLGESLLAQLRELNGEELAMQSIADAFRAKAAQTLLKRAGSLERFARWCFEQDLPSPFQCGEDVLYKYLNFLRSSGARPTSANHFVQAWRFVHGIAVLKNNPPEMVLSPRCLGAARDQYLTKAPLKQKDPLKRPQGDALTAKHTYTQESQRILLPYAALGKGLSGEDWCEAWMQARELEGLELGKGCCLPSLGSNLEWTGVKMSSTEAQMFLHEFLGGSADDATSRGIGTHSLKATLLSWAPRSTEVPFKLSERRLMGHHSLDKRAAVRAEADLVDDPESSDHEHSSRSSSAGSARQVRDDVDADSLPRSPFPDGWDSCSFRHRASAQSW